MFTYYQVYILHLLDGTKIELAEEYDIPEEKGFIGLYSKAPLDEIIQVGDRFTGFSFIPKRNIVYVSTASVVKREE